VLGRVSKVVGLCVVDHDVARSPVDGSTTKLTICTEASWVAYMDRFARRPEASSGHDHQLYPLARQPCRAESAVGRIRNRPSPGVTKFDQGKGNGTRGVADEVDCTRGAHSCDYRPAGCRSVSYYSQPRPRGVDTVTDIRSRTVSVRTAVGPPMIVGAVGGGRGERRGSSIRGTFRSAHRRPITSRVPGWSAGPRWKGLR
jgi:hypothetical protein